MSYTLKTLLIVCVIGLSVPSCFAQTTPPKLDPLPNCGGPFNLCGYMDAAQWKHERTRKIVLGPTFEMTKKFHDGLAPVRIGGKWGYIDENFDIVIEPIFELAGRFDNGLAQVLINNKAGIIGRDGELIIQPKYAEAVPFSKSVFIAASGERRRNVRWGEDELYSYHSSSLGRDEYKGQLYHIRKGLLTKPSMMFRRFAKNNSDFIWAKTDENGALWGLMRANGKWKIKPRFENVTGLHMGRAVVSTSKDNFGAVDVKGRIAVPLKFGSITGWREGWGEYSRVYKGKKVGALDINGRLIGGRYFDDYDIPFDRFQATSLLENETWLSIGADGTLGPDLGYTAFICDNGLKMIRYAESVDFIAPNGETIKGGPFGSNYATVKKCGAPIWVHKGDLSNKPVMQSHVMPDGSLLGGGLIFENMYNFRDGFIAVKTNGKWGIIKPTGEYKVPPKYDSLKIVDGSTYEISLGDDVSYIANDGTLTSKPDAIPTPEKKEIQKAQYVSCRGGTSLFVQNKKWGLKSEDGFTLVQPKQDLMGCYKNGIAWVPDNELGAWCPIDRHANRVKALACKPTYFPFSITHHFPEQFDANPYKNSVMWTRAYYEYGVGLRKSPPRMIPERYSYLSAAEIAKIPTEDLRSGTYSGYKN